MPTTRKGILKLLAVLIPGFASLAGDGNAVAKSELLATDPIAYPAIVIAAADKTSLDVTTLGQHWQITLQRRQLLGTQATLQQALLKTPVFFDGVVDDDPHSWVRLTFDEQTGNFNGHIQTERIIYAVDPAFGKQQDTSRYTVSPLNQTSWSLPLDRQGKSLLQPKATITNPLIPRAIRIGITVDSLFNEHHHGRGLSHALSIINGVDGLFQQTLGLSLVVESIRVYDDPTSDPLRDYTGSVDQLLQTYRTVRMEDPALEKDLGLVHLFSGHNDKEEVIGLGWIETVCQSDGYDLSVSTPFAFDMLLAAHEIAHNLGALHDDDNQCTYDAFISDDSLMWPEITGRSRARFSNCSIDSLQKTLEQSCVLDNMDAAIEISSPQSMTTALGGNPIQIDIKLANRDSLRTTGTMTSKTVFPAGTTLSSPSGGCTIDADSVKCDHPRLGPGKTSTLSVIARFKAARLRVTTQLQPSGFIDTVVSNNRSVLTLRASGTPEPDSLLADPTPPSQQVIAMPSGETSTLPVVGKTGILSLLAGLLLAIRRSASNFDVKTGSGRQNGFVRETGLRTAQGSH